MSIHNCELENRPKKCFSERAICKECESNQVNLKCKINYPMLAVVTFLYTLTRICPGGLVD